MMFNVGDDAIVTKTITRKDRMSIVRPGERVKITRVYLAEEYAIVDIEPYNGMLPMIDICCDKDGPLRSV